MNTSGDYEKLGYLHVERLIPPEVARAVMRGIKEDLGPGSLQLSELRQHGPELNRPAFQFHGNSYRPLSYFLWALTPLVSELLGRDLLPTYGFFRIYRERDICRVHADRPPCEHSISLTLDYSDGEVWALQVAHDRTPRAQPVTDDFGATTFSSIEMAIGDAVAYQGVHHRHGRITPNPNEWSAHLFLHFVERGGPFEDHIFDGNVSADPVNFSFS